MLSRGRSFVVGVPLDCGGCSSREAFANHLFPALTTQQREERPVASTPAFCASLEVAGALEPVETLNIQT